MAVSPKHRGLGRGLDSIILGGVGKSAPGTAAKAPSTAGKAGTSAKAEASKPATGKGPVAPAAPAAPVADSGRVCLIELSKIERNPWQPRREFDAAALQELAASIKANGLLQPILLRPKGNGYEIIAGERRFRAAQTAGLHTIPALVQKATDVEMREKALIENIQRSDLNLIEEALAYRDLAEIGLTQEDIARCVGKARATVANSMRLLDLSPSIQKALSAGTLSAGHAKVLLGVAPESRDLLAARVIAQDLSVRALEKLLTGLASAPKASKPSKPAAPLSADAKTAKQLHYLADRMQQELGTKVQLFPSRSLADGKREMGRILIEYFDNEDLSRLLETLNLGDLL